ncbi:MAG: hypothetical protein GY716_14955 [bacterium]|nr:hypothetical protein [bacterium]
MNPKILRSISSLDGWKGRWSQLSGLSQERLDRIEETVRVQSVAASCRLSGIRVSDSEVAGLLRNEAGPLSDADDIRGYDAALGFEFPDTTSLFDASTLRRFHAILNGSTEQSPWRSQAFHREVFDADGHAVGRVFPTLPPHLIESEVEQLLTWLELELRSREQHPTLVIGAFILGILAASPFEGRNARLTRALVSHLLVRAGYDYLRYASLEAQIEANRGRHHDALDRSQNGFWTGNADLEPWLEVFLDLLDAQRERVETKIGLEREAQDFPPLQRAILETVREHGTVDAGLLLKATGANRNTLKDNVRRLVDRGVLEKTGQRRGTRYRMNTRPL